MRALLKLKLHWQILIALTLALAVGLSVKNGLGPGHRATGHLLSACDYFGKQMFMGLLQMIIVPLIVPSIICGMMGLGDEKNFGRLGLKTLVYYTVSGLVAVLTGLLLVNLIQPGHVDPATANKILAQQHVPENLNAVAHNASGNDLLGIFVRMIPTNVMDALGHNGQLLGVIFFCILFGLFAARLPEHFRKTQKNLWEGLLAIMTRITDLVIRLSPIGVFALVTPIIIETGVDAFAPLAKFFITVMLGLGLHTFVSLPVALKLFGLSPKKHFQASAPALLMAFSTASSASTLPVTLETMEKRGGISNRICGFTLPLGATVNMDGTALYECVVVMFIYQFYSVTTGMTLTLADQFYVAILALMTSIGVAGIPSASLVAITLILGVLKLPIEAIGLVWVVDRVLDMCRTSVNVFSDTCGAAIVAKSEGETNLYPELDGSPVAVK